VLDKPKLISQVKPKKKLFKMRLKNIIKREINNEIPETTKILFFFILTIWPLYYLSLLGLLNGIKLVFRQIVFVKCDDFY